MLDVAGGVVVVETGNVDDSAVVQTMLSRGALGGREGGEPEQNQRQEPAKIAVVFGLN